MDLFCGGAIHTQFILSTCNFQIELSISQRPEILFRVFSWCSKQGDLKIGTSWENSPCHLFTPKMTGRSTWITVLRAFREPHLRLRVRRVSNAIGAVAAWIYIRHNIGPSQISDDTLRIRYCRYPCQLSSGDALKKQHAQRISSSMTPLLK